MTELKLILASASPRRQELLKLITPDFEVIPADIEEISDQLEPQEILMDIARQKAMTIVEAGHQGLVLGVDTSVWLDDQLLGKPRDEADAAQMLRQMSGRSHTVFSGLFAINTLTGASVFDSSATKVFFKPLSEKQIKRYLEQAHYMDKAGAYAIQEEAALFVTRLEGDFYNVMGLPVSRVADLLESLGYQLD